ncbi:MAG: hypothetical protein AB1416_09700 [Actinomycetota bacterium]
MPHTALAGLPRLVRVADEVRLRGLGLVTLAAAVAAYWLLAWLLDEPVDATVTWLNFGGVVLPVAVVAALVSRRRVREGLATARRPPRMSVHETRADARERHTRLAGMLILGVVVLLVFDRATDGGGRMAGLVAGLFLALGVVDMLERRRWDRAEHVRGSRLYVLVRPRALMSPFGVTEVYEIVRSDDRDRPEVDVPYVF